MANNSKNPGNSSNQGNQNSNQNQQQQDSKRDSFEQGMGNNNSTDQQQGQPRSGQPDDGGLNSTQRGDQDGIVNQDRRVTNEDQPMKQDVQNKMPVDDDGDVTNSNNRPEVDSPNMNPEKTEKKLPEMDK